MCIEQHEYGTDMCGHSKGDDFHKVNYANQIPLFFSHIWSILTNYTVLFESMCMISHWLIIQIKLHVLICLVRIQVVPVAGVFAL